MSTDKSSSTDQVLHYHQRTKHYPHKYARSLGYMDWENQPNPFRTFYGTKKTPLLLADEDPEITHQQLWGYEPAEPEPLTLDNLSTMIEYSLALSAWKAVGDKKWALRMNPSSGNLHPTESHWILPPLEGLSGGLYHYQPYDHVLEHRGTLAEKAHQAWKDHLGPPGFFVGLTSIYWRESWKYGERAFRYCLLDDGHALAALSLAARLLGWETRCIDGLSQGELEGILGLDQVDWIEGEKEEGEVLIYVFPRGEKLKRRELSEDLIDTLKASHVKGDVESLSTEIHPWPIIDEAASASRRRSHPARKVDFPTWPQRPLPSSEFSAPEIIGKRRSAVDYDRDQSVMDQSAFLGCLQATLPRIDGPPFDMALAPACVHIFLFVHNVPEMERGFYSFVRNPDHLSLLREKCQPQFAWKKVEDDLPLYFLKSGTFRKEARRASCNQDIAADGAFCAAMVGLYGSQIEANPHRYRELHWEAGMVGHCLYLQAEAYGLGGTGMGCFFDEVLHEYCGFEDDTFQSLYHFAAGEAVIDNRLSTLEAYYHL